MNSRIRYMDATPYQTQFGSTVQPVTTTTLVGTRQQVRADLERLHDNGSLASFSTPQEMVAVEVETYPVSKRPDRLKYRDWLPIVVFVLGAAMITLAAVGIYLLVIAVIAMVAWVTAHIVQVVGTVLILLVLLIWLASKTGGCPGINLHCGGCKG